MDYGFAFAFQSVGNSSSAPIDNACEGYFLYLLVKGIIAVISKLFESNLFSSLANRQITVNRPQKLVANTPNGSQNPENTPAEPPIPVGEEILFSSLGELKPPSPEQLKQDLDRLNLFVGGNRIGNTYEQNKNLSDEERDANKEEMFQQLQNALDEFGFEGKPENDYLRAAVNQAILFTHSKQVQEMFPNRYCKPIQGSISIVIDTKEKTVEQKSSYTIHDLNSDDAPVKESSKSVQVHSITNFSTPESITFKIQEITQL
jgi:hypothetical protein